MVNEIAISLVLQKKYIQNFLVYIQINYIEKNFANKIQIFAYINSS